MGVTQGCPYPISQMCVTPPPPMHVGTITYIGFQLQLRDPLLQYFLFYLFCIYVLFIHYILYPGLPTYTH